MGPFSNHIVIGLQGVDIYKAFFLFKEIPGQPAAYFGDFSSRILPSRE